MQTGINELEAYETVIQKLLVLKKETFESKPGEEEAIESIISNIFIDIACYLKQQGNDDEMQPESKELEAYENIMQNLLTLKEKAAETKLNKVKTIESLSQMLSAQLMSYFLHDPDMAILSDILQNECTHTLQGTGCCDIVINLN